VVHAAPAPEPQRLRARKLQQRRHIATLLRVPVVQHRESCFVINGRFGLSPEARRRRLAIIRPPIEYESVRADLGADHRHLESVAPARRRRDPDRAVQSVAEVVVRGDEAAVRPEHFQVGIDADFPVGLQRYCFPRRQIEHELIPILRRGQVALERRAPGNRAHRLVGWFGQHLGQHCVAAGGGGVEETHLHKIGPSGR